MDVDQRVAFYQFVLWPDAHISPEKERNERTVKSLSLSFSKSKTVPEGVQPVAQVTLRGDIGSSGKTGRSSMVEKVQKLQKVQKAEKWKNIKVPESVWRVIKTGAAKKGLKIYEELQDRYNMK